MELKVERIIKSKRVLYRVYSLSKDFCVGFSFPRLISFIISSNSILTLH